MAFNTISKNVSPAQQQLWIKFLKTESGEEKSKIQIPDEFDGRKAWPNLLINPIDQGQCGACWAYATTSALSDRFNIQTVGKLHLQLAPTRLIICADGKCSKEEMETDPFLKVCKAAVMAGCNHGSSLIEACTFLFLFGAFENSCLPATRDLYVNFATLEEIKQLQADDDDVESPLLKDGDRYFYPALYKNPRIGISCLSVVGPFGDQCDNNDKSRYSPKNEGTHTHSPSTKHARHWRCSAFYTLSGKDAVKFDIFRWGTVVSSMEMTQEFLDWSNNSPGPDQVFVPNWETDHVIKGHHSVCIIGWGKGSEGDHWIIKNSWIKLPYFRYLMRPGDKLGSISSNCIGLVPDFFYTLEGIRDSPHPELNKLVKLRRQVDGDIESDDFDPAQTIDKISGFTEHALSENPGWRKAPFRRNYIPNFATFVAGELPKTKAGLWIDRNQQILCFTTMLVFVGVTFIKLKQKGISFGQAFGE